MRKTLKWYQKLFIRLLLQMQLNAYKLYRKENLNSKRSIRWFVYEVVKTWTQSNAVQQQHGAPRAQDEDGVCLNGKPHMPWIVPTSEQNIGRAQRNCRVCTARGHRTSTTTMCKSCLIHSKVQTKPAQNVNIQLTRTAGRFGIAKGTSWKMPKRQFHLKSRNRTGAYEEKEASPQLPTTQSTSDATGGNYDNHWKVCHRNRNIFPKRYRSSRKNPVTSLMERCLWRLLKGKHVDIIQIMFALNRRTLLTRTLHLSWLSGISPSHVIMGWSRSKLLW